MISFHTNDFHKKHHTLLLCEETFLVVINQINKHKAKIYKHCTYTKFILKIFLLFQYIKAFFVFVKYKNDKSIIKRIETNSTN